MQGGGNMWLDNLYVRLKSSSTTTYAQLVAVVSTGQLWMTGVTLQGNGDGRDDCSTCGLWSTGLVHAYGAATATPCTACMRQVLLNSSACVPRHSGTTLQWLQAVCRARGGSGACGVP